VKAVGTGVAGAVDDGLAGAVDDAAGCDPDGAGRAAGDPPEHAATASISNSPPAVNRT
jgi:hypothetical protein